MNATIVETRSLQRDWALILALGRMALLFSLEATTPEPRPSRFAEVGPKELIPLKAFDLRSEGPAARTRRHSWCRCHGHLYLRDLDTQPRLDAGEKMR